MKKLKKVADSDSLNILAFSWLRNSATINLGKETISFYLKVHVDSVSETLWLSGK